MAQSIEIPVSLGLKDAQAQINQLRQSLQQSVKLDSTGGKGLLQILNNAQKMVDNLTGKMSTSFKSASGSSSFLKDYEKMIGLLTTATEKMTNLGVTDIKFSVSDQQVVDSTIQKIQSLQASLESIQSGKAIEVINMSQVDGIDNLKQKLTELKIDASKFTFDEIGTKLGEAASKADAEVQKLTNDIANINSQMGKLNTQGFTDISKLSDFSTKGVSRILEVGNVDSINSKLQKLAATMTEITVKPMTVTAGANIDSVIESQTKAIEKKYNEQITIIQQSKDKIASAINEVTQAGMRKSADGKVTSGHWTNEQMQQLMSMPSVENIISRLKADTSLNFDNLGIRQQFAKFREALNEELNSLDTQKVNLQGLRDSVKDQVTQVFEGAGEAIVGNKSQIQNSIKSLFSNLGINGDELKKIFDINSISSGDKMVDVINRIKEGLTSYIDTLDKTANTDLAAKLKEAQTSFDGLTQAQNTNKNVSQESGNAAQTLQDQINTLAKQIQDLVDKYNQLTGKNINFDIGNIEGAKGRIESYIQSLNKLQSKQKALGNIQMAVNRWMGFWQVLNMTKSAINDMKQHIQELDSVMTSISVVTNFSQEDLWGQISQYSEIARQYGVAIKGVYEVSQIYYQQGLQQNDVMTLTTETLKMARIAGLDYATAADYMTTAIRGFKLEMTDAAHVTDVFSALAATTASSTEEIAVAISKTAASAEAVGASFEATSAMMATMIATTRESATNIGTALKSVISRYGEMTSDPSKTVDSEGEEMSLNRVDKALQTVGITIHDTAGQFRDFDDVMLELMEKWDSLDSLSQRYIATLMAGNRQQSRFLALVSNVDEYKKALQTAMDSEGTGELQTLKTLDSIDAKIEKMKVTIQEFYTSSGIEELYKGILDGITNIVSAANSLPKAFNKIPVAAIAMGASIITAVKSAIQVILGEIQAGLEMMKGNTQSTMTGLISMMAQGGRQSGEAYRKEQEAAMNGSTAGSSGISKSAVISGMILRYAGAALSLYGAGQTLKGMNAYGSSLTKDEDQTAAAQVRTGGILGILGSTASGAAMGASFGPYGAIIGGAIGGIKGLVENIATLTSATEMYNVSVAREIELSGKRLEAAKQEQLEAKNSEKQLEQAYTKLKELEEHQYDSAEAQQEYYDYMNQLADSYPAYVEKIDQANNAIIYSGTLEEELAKARELTASATTKAIEAELDKASWQETSINNFKTGLAGLYSSDTDNNGGNLKGLAQVVRKAAGTEINQPTQLNYRALFEEDSMTEEQAAEYLVKAYLSRHSNIELEHYNRATGLTDLSQFGTRYTYQGLLKQKIGENDESLLQMIMTDSNLGAERDAQRYSRSQFEELLNNLADESEKAGQKVSLETVTKNKNIKEASDIYNLTEIEFQAALAEAKNWANESSTVINSTKQGIETALVNAKAREKVTAQINTLESKQDKTLAEQYENLIAYGMAAKFGQKIDKVDSAQFNEAFTNLSDWIKNNQESAEALAHIDYSQYISFEELKDSIKNFGDLDDQIESQIEEDFEEARNNAVTLYKNQLIGIFGDGKAPDWLNDTDKFTNRTLTAIQSDLKEYQSFIDKQQYAQAEAYLNSMKAIYGPDGIGSLSGDEQTKVFDVIKDLDLSDQEQLRTAAETLTNMGGNFEKIASQFTNSASRWATSAATLLEQLSSSTQETAKSIETSISDMSKVFKYSEALEKAQALIDANEGVKFDELFTYDKDLGGYVKTAKAFQLEMAELQNQQIEGIQQAITDTTVILPKALKSLSYDRLASDYVGSKHTNQDIAQRAIREGKQTLSSLTGVTDGATLDRLWIQYTQMMQEFDALEEADKDWSIFVDKYIQEHGDALQLQLDEINNMSSQMASLQLESFDYTSIVSGKGTAQTKETLKALIQSSLKDGTQFDFNTFWTNLITGQIDNANEALAKADLGQISKGQANRARFEALKSLYDKIASGDVVYSALEPQEKELLKVTNELAGFEATDMANGANALLTAIWNLYATGVFSLSEMADSVTQAADKTYGNTSKEKSYQLLDKYKDGLTAEELVALQGDNKGLFIDEKTGKLSSTASQYLTYDNGKFIARAGQDAASVLAFLAQVLGYQIDTTTQEYKDAIQTSINEEITRLDNTDIDKQRASQISALDSAKVGDRLNVSLLSSATQKRLTEAGLDITNGILTVTSEEALNSGILALKDKLTQGHWAERHPVEAREIESIVSTLESRMNKMTGLSGIISESVTKDAAEAFALAFEGTTEKAPEIMERMGAIWDNLSQTWIIDEDDLDEIESYIQELESLDTTGANATAISQMRTQVENLRDSFARRPAQALNNILTNYTNVSNDMIATFDQYWLDKVDISEYIISIDEVTGNKKIDIVGLKQALIEAGEEVEELFNEVIAQVTDELLGQLSTGVTFQISGTNNFTEMQNFVDNINEKLESNFTINDLFSYNTALDSFTLNTTAFNNYKKALEKELQDLHWSQDLIDEYIKDQTDVVIQQSIELDSFLNANTSKQRNDEASKLIQQIRGLSNYKNLFSTDTLAARFSQGGWSEAIAEQYDQLILETLESGSQAAVDLLKQIKPDASQEQLKAVYNNQINKLKQAQEDLSKGIGETISGIAITIAEAADFELTKLDDGTAVINSIGDMVIAHNLLYQVMEEKNASIADKNIEYANILTALDQKNIDALETLQNAYGMTYQAFADLMTQYGKEMKDVLGDSAHYGEITRDGFGNLRIEDFKLFAKGMGWDLNSPEIKEAYSNWVDARAEWQNKPAEIVQSATDQLKGIFEAKTGDAVNISYLQDVLGLSDSLFNSLFSKYNVILTDGLLQLQAGVDIPGLITAIAQHAAEAGKLLPEQLAELADAVEGMLSQITSLITGGINGSLSNVDAQKLTSWAKENGIEKLDFTRTADGLRLATNSARELYSVINQIDGIQGQIVFDALKESLIEVNDEFKTVQDTTALIKNQTETIKAVSREYQTQAGNVQLYRHARHQISGEQMIAAGWTDFNKDDYATLYSSTYSGDEYDKNIILNITPITNDGKTILGPEDLDAYVSELMEKSSSSEEIMLNDDKHLVMGAWDVDVKNAEKLAEGLEVASNEADRLHQESAAIANNLDALDTTSDARINQYKEELNLAKQINAERSTTEDDSFKFMENDIPSGQNNPLNYWENWAKAFDAMKKAGSKKGIAKNTIGYEDFYNIVSEMGRLADITGQAVVLGDHTLTNSETAADLITQAAGALKNVDGELVVDLSGINIDFTSGLDDLGNQVDAQVDALADSQIAMLDSLIALLEVIVAMEKLQDVDADADMTIDLDEIFEFNVEGDPTKGIKGFTEKYDKWRQSILDQLKKYNADGTKNKKFNKDLSDAIGKIKIDGINLKDMIEWDESDWKKQGPEIMQTYSDILSVLFKASLSDNYDEDNVAASIQQVLKESGLNRDISIDVGDYTVTMSGGQVKIIDWTTDNAKNAVARYIKENKGATEETAHNEIMKYVEAYNNGEALKPEQLEYVLEVYKHITIKDGQTTVTWGDDEFDASTPEGKAAIAAWRAQDAGVNIGKDWNPENAVADSEGYYNFEYEITADETINVKSNGTDIQFFDDNGNPQPSQEKMFKENYEKWASENLAKDENGNYITNNETGDLTYEAWKYARYNIRVQTQTTITDKDGKKYDPINDPSTRKAVKDAYDKISNAKELGDLAHVNKEGNVEVALDDKLVLTLSGEGIVLEDGSVDQSALIAELAKTLGLDTALQETITTAITNAFSQLPNLFSQMNESAPNDAATALQNMASAAAQLATVSWEAISQGLASLKMPEGGLPNFSGQYPPRLPYGNRYRLGYNGSPNAGLGGGAFGMEFEEPDITPFTDAIEDIKTIDLTEAGRTIGVSLANGVTEGIEEGPTSVNEAAENLGLVAIEALDNTLNEKIINEIGENAGTYLVNGLNNKNAEAYSAGKALGDKIVEGMRACLIPITMIILQIIGQIALLNQQEIKLKVDTTSIDAASKAIDDLRAKMEPAETDYKINIKADPIPDPPAPVSVDWVINVKVRGGNTPTISEPIFEGPTVNSATGNFGLAKAKGVQTLMGELGPELVVSNGHYFVVGQNGAEMVDLADDAIVFNHLQTEQLLKKGMSSGRGRAVTNERNAVSFATGNINGGPAMASASAALAALKQLRAMWESLKNASVKDLAGKGGGGGGGGGGGDNASPGTWTAWLDQVERWYNLMQEIAKLEQQITHEETLRSKLQSDFTKNGKNYFNSQMRSLDALERQVRAQEELNLSRENYFEQRRQELNTQNGPFNQLYTFDEEGQIKFRDDVTINGQTGGYAILAEIMRRDDKNKPNYSAEEQYNYLIKAGFGDYMQYTSSGEKIERDPDAEDQNDFYTKSVEAVWDFIEAQKEEMQTLHDDIEEGKNALLEAQTKQNEILAEMRDNQMSVEDAVLDAIVSSREREIDALEDERDKLEDSVGKYIDGLNQALDKEREMYDTQEAQNELDTKRRRLSILQRSGGSAADISSLQKEILANEKDLYFDAQQAQIDAIQEASDLEIARLDSQIQIMQETLDYQKEFGLLWYQVYDVMKGSSEEITTFIMGQNSDFWKLSPLGTATQANDTLFQADQWRAYQEKITNGDTLLNELVQMRRDEVKQHDYDIFNEAMTKQFGADYDKSGKYKQMFNDIYEGEDYKESYGGDVTQVTSAITKAFQYDASIIKRKQEAGQYWTHTGQYRYIDIDDNQHWKYTYKNEVIDGVKGWYYVSKNKENHSWANGVCSKCGHKQPAPKPTGGGGGGGGNNNSSGNCNDCQIICGGACTNKCSRECSNSSSGPNSAATSGTCKGGCTADCKNGCRINTEGGTYKAQGKYAGGVTTIKAATGGYVNHGIYELGELGTETVLTASQTKVLRNNILSNRPNSLISLLKSYNESYSNISKPLTGVTSAVEDNSTNIDKVELTMNVQQMSSDYDAKRAGEQALNEIMRIARKTSAANSIRR